MKEPTQNATIDGIGPAAAIANRIRSVRVNFRVGNNVIVHALRNVLYVPEAPNCLMLLSRFDEGGGTVNFGNGRCVLKDKAGKEVGTGRKTDWLYLLDAQALLHRKRANVTVTYSLRDP